LHLGDNACGEVSERVVRVLVRKHEVQEGTKKSSLNNDDRLTRRSDRRDPTQWEIRVSKNRYRRAARETHLACKKSERCHLRACRRGNECAE
jgi:hypothetical protein